MKDAKKRGADESQAAPIPLLREDWDFSACLMGLEFYCFFYEFAREVPNLFLKPDGSLDAPAWFPDQGFPETPFLLVKHKARPFPPRIARNSERGIVSISLRVLEQAEHKMERMNYALLWIDWRKSDKQLIKDFKGWLQRSRIISPVERRGKGQSSQYIAELKALGAHRLRKVFRSPQKAANYCRSVKGANYTHYKKDSDWYAAERRVRTLLKDWFPSTLAHGYFREDTVNVFGD